MKKVMAGWTMVFVLASAGSLVAHHSLANFDTTKAVTVKGTVVFLKKMNPHSVLIVDQKIADGKVQRWAVDGPAIPLFDRRGITNETFKIGDIIEVCGYVTREGIESTRTIDTEPISLSLKEKTPKSMSGKIMNGEMLVIDGKKIPWSDYGQHKCLGEDYKDGHTR